MESVTFKKGILYDFHGMLFTDDPKTTCQFRLQLAICLLVSVLFPWGFLGWLILFNTLKFGSSGEKVRSIGLFIVGSVFAIMSTLMVHKILEEKFDIFFWSKMPLIEVILWSFPVMIVGMIFLAITMLLGIGLLYLIFEKLLKKLTFKVPNILTNVNGEPVSQAGELYVSFKERFCKKINWK